MRRLAALLLALPLTAAAPAADYDLLIRGGHLIDGSGAPAVRADVAVRDGRIVRLGDLSGARAARVIDATGLVVAPGFIDVHTHADGLAERPRAENFVRMGVTTVVAGNCGSSPVEIGPALDKIRKAGPAINFATLIGQGSVRHAVMGDARRNPTPAELEKMKDLVRRALAEGAVGLSTGLQYVPGTYAESSEIIELARVACKAGGLYASHMRNEGTEIDASVAETIGVGEAAGCRVQISHLKIDSPKNWGAGRRALERIDAARSRGIDVEADQYAYTAAASALSIRFPAWALEGGPEEVHKRLDDEAAWTKIREEMRGLLAERGFTDLSFAVVAGYAPDRALEGLSMKEVARRLIGTDTPDAQFEAARRMLRAGGAGMVYHLMSEEDVESILRHPWVAVASDGDVQVLGEGSPHPRSYGNNARILAAYVRERKVIPLEESIRKMTALPAAHFRLDGRGLVKEGAAADLVVFDPAKVRDLATFEKPHAHAAGFAWVLVNGVPVIASGEPTGAGPGQVLTVR
jgi:N-acyl-D-amino-acid deacylase